MTSATLDGDRPTLHIRCGSDIRDKLVVAGFAGVFLAYSDPVCEGPVLDVADYTAVRSRYLAESYGWFEQMTEAALKGALQEADQRLDTAQRYERVVLWFEHGSYDQLVLAPCMARLADGPLPARLELICIDHHPDIPRFNGLGQLEPAALAALWPGRRAVTAAQIALGSRSGWRCGKPIHPGCKRSPRRRRRDCRSPHPRFGGICGNCPVLPMGWR